MFFLWRINVVVSQVETCLDFGRVFFFQRYLYRTGRYALMHQRRTGQAVRRAGLCRDWFIALPFLVVCQRRALRTASEKLRNRTSFSATAVQHSPATRVNRYIGRLIEARQTESGTSDLNYFTLFYRSGDRERKVRAARANKPFTRVCTLPNGFKYHLLSSLRMSLHASWLPPPPRWLPPHTLSNSCSPSPSLPR